MRVLFVHISLQFRGLKLEHVCSVGSGSTPCRRQRPPSNTNEVPTRQAFGPRTLAHLDAQPSRRTRRDGRHGRSRARPPHRIPHSHHLQQLRHRIATFTVFCDEERIAPAPAATAADMRRFTTWLARAGTVAASSLQPYFSAITIFFRNHLQEPLALGTLLTDARRGLASNPSPTRPTFAYQSEHPSYNICY
jgi:hypothetical protein